MTPRTCPRLWGTSWLHIEPQTDGPSFSLGLTIFPGGTKPLCLLMSQQTLAPGTGKCHQPPQSPGSISAQLCSHQMKELTLLQGQEQTRVPQLPAFTTKHLSQVEISFKRQGKA